MDGYGVLAAMKDQGLDVLTVVVSAEFRLLFLDDGSTSFFLKESVIAHWSSRPARKI